MIGRFEALDCAAAFADLLAVRSGFTPTMGAVVGDNEWEAALGAYLREATIRF